MNNEQNIVKKKSLSNNKKMQKAIKLYNEFNKPKVKRLSIYK